MQKSNWLNKWKHKTLFSYYQTAEVFTPQQSGNNWTILWWKWLLMQWISNKFLSWPAEHTDDRGKQWYYFAGLETGKYYHWIICNIGNSPAILRLWSFSWNTSSLHREILPLIFSCDEHIKKWYCHSVSLFFRLSLYSLYCLWSL